MIPNYELNQWKKWATSTQLSKAIHQALLSIDQTHASIVLKLQQLQQQYNDSVGLDTENGLAEGIPIHKYGDLTLKFLGILKRYEAEFVTQEEEEVEEEEIEIQEEEEEEISYRHVDKKHFIKSAYHAFGEQLTWGSYASLVKAIGQFLMIVGLVAGLFLGVLWLCFSGLVDDNWLKIYAFFMGSLSLYGIFSISYNWMQYYPSYRYSHQIYKADINDYFIENYKLVDAPPAPKLNFNTIKNSQVHLWSLLFSFSKPSWNVASRLLKWHVPILEGLKFYTVPFVLAIGCLLGFQTFLNYAFPLHGLVSDNQMALQEGLSNWINTYHKVSLSAYSLIAISASLWGTSIFLLFLYSLFVRLDKQIEKLLKNTKSIRRWLLRFSIFFATLSAITFGGAVVKNNFVQHKMDYQVNILKKRGLLYSFVTDVTENTKEEIITEALLEDENFIQLLVNITKYEGRVEQKQHELDRTVDEINVLVSKWGGEKSKKEDFTKKATYRLLNNLNEINKESQKTTYRSPKYPIDPSPKPPDPDSKEAPLPTEDVEETNQSSAEDVEKTNQSSTPGVEKPNQSPTEVEDKKGPVPSKHIFTPKSVTNIADKIWKEQQDELSTEQLEKASIKEKERHQSWRTTISKKIKKKAVPYLKKTIGDGKKPSLLIQFFKSSSKEGAKLLCEAFAESPLTSLLCEAVYEYAFDAKVETFAREKVDWLLKEEPSIKAPEIKKMAGLDDKIFKDFQKEMDKSLGGLEEAITKAKSKLAPLETKAKEEQEQKKQDIEAQKMQQKKDALNAVLKKEKRNRYDKIRAEFHESFKDRNEFPKLSNKQFNFYQTEINNWYNYLAKNSHQLSNQDKNTTEVLFYKYLQKNPKMGAVWSYFVLFDDEYSKLPAGKALEKYLKKYRGNRSDDELLEQLLQANKYIGLLCPKE